MEAVAELTVLAIAMFLAAFFCLRLLVLPDATAFIIDKAYEVEETIYQER
jgi:hypothetical protein